MSMRMRMRISRSRGVRKRIHRRINMIIIIKYISLITFTTTMVLKFGKAKDPLKLLY